MRKTYFIVIAVTMLIHSALYAQNSDVIEQDKERLKKFEESIEDQKGKINKISVVEKSIFDELKMIQNLIDDKIGELERIEAKRDELEIEINAHVREIAELKEKVTAKREHIMKRAVVLYKYSDTGYLKILFSSSSYVDMLKRYKYLKLILKKDSELIDEYSKMQGELADKTEIIKNEKEKLDEIVKKVKNKDDEIMAERNSKEILLLKVKREKGKYVKAQKELTDSAQKLEELIAKHYGDGADNGTFTERFADYKGVLASPVDDCKVITLFGKEQVSKFNSYLFNNGIKFAAEIGREVKAVFGGKVVYSDWFKGYGKLAIISHGDGYYTIYSHLEKIIEGVGSVVKRGDVIGLVGDTGSLDGACLYFEVRYKGRSVDPLKWLEPTIDTINAKK